jgi:hypothetical protein
MAARHGFKLPHELANRLEQLTIAQLVPLVCTPETAAASADSPTGAAGGAVASARTASESASPALRIIERDGRVPKMPLRPVGGLSACATGELGVAQELARSGGWHAAHAVDKHGNSSLMWAAGGGWLQVVRWLLGEVGVAADTSNKDGRTALMWACKNGHAGVVRYLLEEGGADVTLRMKDDSSAFDWAVLGGDPSTMELLAAHPKVDIRALNKFGCVRQPIAAPAAPNPAAARINDAPG